MKVTRKHNYRVMIEPKGYAGYMSVSQDDRDSYDLIQCRQIEEQVGRHVDNVYRTTIDYDVEERCSHCKHYWSEDENGVPECCDTAIEEYNSKKQTV